MTDAQSDCSASDCRIASVDQPYLLEILYSGTKDDDKKIHFFDDTGTSVYQKYTLFWGPMLKVTFRLFNLVYNKYGYHYCGHKFCKFLVYNNFSHLFLP